jgi:hypothetical protein
MLRSQCDKSSLFSIKFQFHLIKHFFSTKYAYMLKNVIISIVYYVYIEMMIGFVSLLRSLAFSTIYLFYQYAAPPELWFVGGLRFV